MRVSSLPRSFAVTITFLCCLNIAAARPAGSGHRSCNSGVSLTFANGTTQFQNQTIQSTNHSTQGEAQGFWAGACIGTVERGEAIEGRIFYDYDGVTVKDPFATLGDSNFNAFRIVTSMSTLSEAGVNHTNELHRELNFQLDFDFGGMQRVVKSAQRAIDAGMKKFQLTIHMGEDIPEAWIDYSYAQMIDAIKTETKRQLQPFLDAKILPDIILFENEGSWGMLYKEPNGHTRGNRDDGKAAGGIDQVNDELCGRRPTGTLASYPQAAGYYKAEAQACTEAITAAGFDVSRVRFGLHSHGQYVDWKQSVVFNTNDPNFEKISRDTTGKDCDFNGIIPDNILNESAADMLDIMGFSAYPDPMQPTDIYSDDSLQATFGRLRTTLDHMDDVAERYGRWTDGPFQGQYKKQAFGVEYATNFGHEQTDEQIEARSRHTQMMWNIVKKYEFFLGMLWWEPWYCFNNWEGGDATLCKRSFTTQAGEATPMDTMKVWGNASVSPWN